MRVDRERCRWRWCSVGGGQGALQLEAVQCWGGQEALHLEVVQCWGWTGSAEAGGGSVLGVDRERCSWRWCSVGVYRFVGMYHIQQHSPDFDYIWAQCNFLIWDSPVIVFGLGRWRSIADRVTDFPQHYRGLTKCRVYLIHGCTNFYGKGPYP